MRQKSTWTELPADAGATHWRVRCCIPGCGFEAVKASKRNVRLCEDGHLKRHPGVVVQSVFTVTPLRREVESNA